MRYPLYSYLLLINPARVHRNLDAAQAAGIVGESPNTWQLCLGALRMWTRMIARPETLGTSSGPPRRPTWRARLLENRAMRLPFLLAGGAVAPWDLTGLFSSADRLTRHLLAAHHDRNQFVFDFQLLASHPGRLAELTAMARAFVAESSPRTRWLRDLTVFEDYHETLLDAAEAALAGDFRLTEAQRRDPDLTLSGLVNWCASSPSTPRETVSAWRANQFSFLPDDTPTTSAPRVTEVHHASA